MFKKLRSDKDAITSNSNGWQLDIVQRLSNPRHDVIDNKKLFCIYDFTIHGFTYSLDLPADKKLPEDARKAYGTLQLQNPDINIVVIVDFIVSSGKDIRLYAEVDERYDPKDPKYRLSLGYFLFNTIDGGYLVEDAYKIRIPFLDFRIELLPNEWDDVKESFWLAKIQNGCPSIKMKVEYPETPEAQKIVENGYSNRFRVVSFWINSLLVFDSKALSANLAFREHLGLGLS